MFHVKIYDDSHYSFFSVWCKINHNNITCIINHFPYLNIWYQWMNPLRLIVHFDLIPCIPKCFLVTIIVLFSWCFLLLCWYRACMECFCLGHFLNNVFRYKIDIPTIPCYIHFLTFIYIYWTYLVNPYYLRSRLYWNYVLSL